MADMNAKQGLDLTLIKLNNVLLRKIVKAFSQGVEGVLTYQGHLCVPNINDLREDILSEAHNFLYCIHLGDTKMYSDLWEIYWWNGKKGYCGNCG